MTTIHVISDLHLGAGEIAEEESIIPDVDLVIINGNIGFDLKRSMFYAENLAHRYPKTQFVCNLGQTELYSSCRIPKYTDEVHKTLKTRITHNNFWPNNLHLNTESKILELRDGSTVDVLTLFGFPKIHRYNGKWEDHFWYKYIISEVSFDYLNYKLANTSNVDHGEIPIWASLEWVNKQHDIESSRAREWELTPGHRKILVTHINPLNDSRCNNQVVSPYLIHLQHGLWVASNTKQKNHLFVGARLVSNPGRGKAARGEVIHF